MYLDGTSIKFVDSTPSDINGNLSQKAVCRCMLNLSTIKLEFPNTSGDLELNTKTLIQTDSKYLNGYLWMIEEKIFETQSIEYAFSKSGMHKVEFWGTYINGETVYLCGNVFVKKKVIPSSQSYDNSKVKLIETDFAMKYTGQLHFVHSNCPVSPRIDGGYYIAVTDNEEFLHVLSYNKDDSLIKDFNTTEKAYPHDITSTDYGFAVYMIEAGSTYHSYLSLYNKNFELVKTVQIMNNSKDDDMKVDSNLEKQIIKYDNNGNPVYGMRFMYRPDNGKLIYSRGRIFLIFAHYNYFLDSRGHTGDTVVTFNDALSDMDFGCNWGSSHSLIQSATFDEFYFWTAALGDAYPQGINVEYTSKRDFSTSYDSINKKCNTRIYKEYDTLAGNIKGYANGSADGKLGGILYFEKFGLYCLVYAKTPDPSSNKNVIYLTTWEFSDKQTVNINTKEVKIFETGNVMQVRAGKYGEDKVFIIYSETNSSGGNSYGNVPKGTTPKLYIIQLPSYTFVQTDETNDKLLMNTNEDLRTFDDGVLIWATSNSNGKLVINKIGTPLLDETYDDNDYILTEDDLKNTDNTDNTDNKDKKEEEEKKKGMSTGAKVGIALGVIFGVSIIGGGIFILIKFIKNKKVVPEESPQSNANVTVYSKTNINKNEVVQK